MKMEAKEIAVRLYENKKYGTTYGKGLFHSAVFNGSADVLGSNTKYLLDYYPYERFEHTARTDEQMEVLRELGAVKSSNLLFSWVVQYNPATKLNAISGLDRISRPGLRKYVSAEELPRVQNGLGIALVSTSKGLMTDKEARNLHVGGEVMCYVY
jgi:ribosomal protein S8